MKKFYLFLICCSFFLFTACSDGTNKDSDSGSSAFLQDDDSEEDDDFEEDGGTGNDPETDLEPDEDSETKVNPCRKDNPCEKMGMGGVTGVCIHDEEGGYSCECMENYTWDGKICAGNTRTADCTGLPEHAHWTTSSNMEQRWNYEDGWYPPAVGRYSWLLTSECNFRCDRNYFWNGSECINLCDSDPCAGIPHSDGICSSVGVNLYTCGCEENYYWWGERRGCITQKPALGNVCSGQNECYDNAYEIECPTDPDDAFFGQEAHYARLGACSPLDITVDLSIPDETLIINRNTGLMWQRNVPEERPSDAGTYCKDLIYAGYDDWRLPSFQELLSIIVSSKYIVEYSNTLFPYYMIYDDTPFHTSEYLISFYDNRIASGSYGNSASTICVRGEKLPSAELELTEINGDEVVIDSTTGLMWQKSHGEKPLWKQALAYCENLVYAGYSDWRLPNRNELMSLNYYKADISDFYYYGSGQFFSSTTSFNGLSNWGIIDVTNTACGISFNQTKLNYIFKSDQTVYPDNYIHCVRSELCPDGQFLRGMQCLDNPCITASCEVPYSTGICIPETETDYECQCLEGFFWNGTGCVNPCDTDPCSKIANSDGNCTAVAPAVYYCGCNEGYTWASGKCNTSGTNVKTLGNICTGQKTCYNDSEDIPCPKPGTDFYGQDAQYAGMKKCTEQNFSIRTVSNQNIITDNNTELEWQQASPQKQLSWNDAYAYCDSLEYGGKSDWRLPAPHEIMTIVNYGKGLPAIDRTYFTGIPEYPSDDRNFWTDNALILDSSEGWTFSYPSKDDLYFVICVRGKTLPKAELSFSTQEDDRIAFDSATGLYWTTEYFSASEWSRALSLCENMVYAGYNDWRLPNKNELSSLIGSYQETDTKLSFPPSAAWSSTTYPRREEFAVIVNLSGEFEYALKNFENYYPPVGHSYAVICVRN